jgi:hypothetical protein
MKNKTVYVEDLTPEGLHLQVSTLSSVPLGGSN